MARSIALAGLLLLGGCVTPVPVGSYISVSAIFTDGAGRQCQLVRRVGSPAGAPVTMVCLDADGVWRPARPAAAAAPPLPPAPPSAYVAPPTYTARPSYAAPPSAATEPLRAPAPPSPTPPVQQRVPQEPQPNALGPPIVY